MNENKKPNRNSELECERLPETRPSKHHRRNTIAYPFQSRNSENPTSRSRRARNYQVVKKVPAKYDNKLLHAEDSNSQDNDKEVVNKERDKVLGGKVGGNRQHRKKGEPDTPTDRKNHAP